MAGISSPDRIPQVTRWFKVSEAVNQDNKEKVAELFEKIRTNKKPRKRRACGALILEAEVGIEPAFTDLQSAA